MPTVILISGRSGVGKSSAANGLHKLLSHTEHGLAHAALEANNLAMVHPEARGPDLFMQNLGCAWRVSTEGKSVSKAAEEIMSKVWASDTFQVERRYQ